MITTNSQHTLSLNGFSHEELFHPEGLSRLDQAFLQTLKSHDPAMHAELLQYRANQAPLDAVKTSDLLIRCAALLEDFLANLFKIEEAVAMSKAQTTANNPVSAFKKYFILRRAKKELGKANSFPAFNILHDWLQAQLEQAPLKTEDAELAIALLAQQWLADADDNQANIEQLVQWCTQALATPEGQAFTQGWVSFQIPERLDYQNLVKVVPLAADKLDRKVAPENEWRERDGFKLTDPRMNARQVQDEINYCIYCHDHEGDFCSSGFPVKKGDPEQGLKKNPLDLTMTGCPLEEKISEMHLLKKEGRTLASLAMVMVDNPMCPATGHRICNDCMKACIYQKQEPVNIPQIETRVLTDVLDLPWGVEIYDLLTRWNPLRQHQWVMKPYNGLKVMIAGMGPAGFTLAHHLLLEGFAVVGFDGLKIEPLPEHLIKQPIRHFDHLKEALDERIMAGFGGVAEYGITVRWDKNFLKLIYLSLMRRPHFQVFGGVRFGGTITIEDAWEMGFDHFAVAVGAGLPKALAIPNSMAPGMRQANDFLMALQLGNAAKASSLTNLQIRLPAVVIGGGLTGIDTATEAQAYYITQIEKILFRYEAMQTEHGEAWINQQLDSASQEILNEFLTHGRAARQERQQAAAEKRQPQFLKLIHAWGGVTIAYRRSMQESPAYINNHEEVRKALQEGIYYAAGLEPAALDLNEHGHAEALVCHKRIKNQDGEWVTSAEEVRLPARSILVATGTQPNTAYEFEHRGTFNRLNLQYQHYEDEDGELNVAHGVAHCKDTQFGAFTSYHKHDRRVSLIGDTHPVFHGNVVKAIASGMRTYPKILAVLKSRLEQQGDETEYQRFAEKMRHLFTAQVTQIRRKNNEVIELKIQAPLASKHFQPGQFYRLQNFESFAAHFDHTHLQMEPLALVASACDHQHGILTFYVREHSATSKLCATLKTGDPVSLMGPAGVRSKVPTEHETVLIIGNKNSFPFTLSYGTAIRQAGNHVIYVCEIENQDEVYCQEELASAIDSIWYYSNSQSNLHDVLKQYDNDGNNLSLKDVDRVFVVGDTSLLKRFQSVRAQVVKDYLIKDPSVIGSVYGNMQCMLKGVCAQCLQWQIDPETGQRTKAVFACSWQDQPLEIIDIHHLDERQMQNRLSDTISKLWVDHVFAQYAVEKI